MKIIKIFGAVVAVHAVAFLVIFANPGCNATKTPGTASVSDANPMSDSIIIPVADTASPTAEGPSSFSPGASSSLPRYSPTRPKGSTSEVSVTVTPTSPSSPSSTAAAGTSQVSTNAGPVETRNYQVVSGDSLWTVARRHGVTLNALALANGLPSDARLRVGQRLIVPAATTTVPAAEPAAAAPKSTLSGAAAARSEGAMTHVVKEGDTLSQIAAFYGVRQAELATRNNIADPERIRPGTTLVIPGWQGNRPPEKAETTVAPAPSAQGTAAAPATPAANVSPAPTGGEIPVIRIDDAPPSP